MQLLEQSLRTQVKFCDADTTRVAWFCFLYLTARTNGPPCGSGIEAKIEYSADNSLASGTAMFSRCVAVEATKAITICYGNS